MANIKKLPLFVRCVIQNFPFIEEDFDALTNYQLISKVVEFLNKVIASQNEVIDVANNLQVAFQQLHDYVENYFDNLDVQEEINNKLDAMVEAGTLQEIITTYIQSNVAWTFDTVADMKLATNLVAGSYARTLGFYALDDGGGATYYITDTGTANEMSVIAVDDLYANLVIKDEMCIDQFGAKGDGTSNDQDVINLALNTNLSVLTFNNAKTYAVKAYETGQPEGSTTGLTGTTGIVVPSNKIIDLNFATIKVIPNNRQNYNIFTLTGVSNVIIKNGKLVGDVGDHTDNGGEWGYGVSLRIAKNITLENLYITKCWGDGINLNNDGQHGDFNTNVIISNCTCDDNRRQGMSIENADDVIVENSNFINTGYTARTAPTAGVDVEPAGDTAKNIIFKNCDFSYNYNSGLLLDGDNIDGVNVEGCKFINNEATTSASILYAGGCRRVVVSNCLFKCTLANYKFNVLRCSDGIIFKDNELYDIHVHLMGDKSSHEVDYILNNNFYISIACQYNSIIELVTTSVNKNELVIEGNSFENINNNKEIYIREVVWTPDNKGYAKVTLRDNIVKNCRKGFSTGISAIIENNNFIAGQNFPIAITDGTANLPSQTVIIKGNVLEGTSYYTYVRHAITTVTAVPTVMIDNTLFLAPLNDEDTVTYPESYVPNTWFNNEPTVFVNDNNNIVDNRLS